MRPLGSGGKGVTVDEFSLAAVTFEFPWWRSRWRSGMMVI
jgi:hypothetical protein